MEPIDNLATVFSIIYVVFGVGIPVVIAAIIWSIFYRK